MQTFHTQLRRALPVLLFLEGSTKTGFNWDSVVTCWRNVEARTEGVLLKIPGQISESRGKQSISSLRIIIYYNIIYYNISSLHTIPVANFRSRQLSFLNFQLSIVFFSNVETKLSIDFLSSVHLCHRLDFNCCLDDQIDSTEFLWLIVHINVFHWYWFESVIASRAHLKSRFSSRMRLTLLWAIISSLHQSSSKYASGYASEHLSMWN